MAKITCYIGRIETLVEYIYNPNTKEVLRVGQEGKVLDKTKIIYPVLERIYINKGTSLKIEEEDFQEISDKITKMENLKLETTGLVKKLLSKL